MNINQMRQIGMTESETSAQITPFCAARRTGTTSALPRLIGGCARRLGRSGSADTLHEASVVDVLAWFGVVHADMPVTLASIWLAIRGSACSEGPARHCFPRTAGA
jgi:hypothetical protein